MKDPSSDFFGDVASLHAHLVQQLHLSSSRKVRGIVVVVIDEHRIRLVAECWIAELAYVTATYLHHSDKKYA
jgi:hypothetical protein